MKRPQYMERHPVFMHWKIKYCRMTRLSKAPLVQALPKSQW